MHECTDTKKIHLEINKNCVKREKFLTQIFFLPPFRRLFHTNFRASAAQTL